MSRACNQFTRANLPNPYQTKTVEDLIKQMTERVVYIRAKVNTKTVNTKTRRGSGIVFKSDDELYVQTCRHVVEEEVEITVIFGDIVDDSSRSTIAKRIGSCRFQDKAIYRLNSSDLVPSCFMEMSDVSDLVVDIKTDKGRKVNKGLVEYDMSGNQYVIHSSIPYSHAVNPAQYTVHFQNGTFAVCTDIGLCSSTCCRLYIDSSLVPKQTTDLFKLDPPWQYNQDWVVVVISFPKPSRKEKRISLGKPYSKDSTTGKEKRISLGKPYSKDSTTIVSAEDFGIASIKNAMILKHTAFTRGGSSGGCLLIIGKDLSSYLGYKSYLGMHIGREEGFDFNYGFIGLINQTKP
ncbi:hypothetical protein SNE40_022379 [Patella caerulea]|uniref:Serine protease n=1 Tax=Patella caerulea TaxID=87958 RepID=A0AAN8IZK4_PATCE